MLTEELLRRAPAPAAAAEGDESDREGTDVEKEEGTAEKEMGARGQSAVEVERGEGRERRGWWRCHGEPLWCGRRVLQVMAVGTLTALAGLVAHTHFSSDQQGRRSLTYRRYPDYRDYRFRPRYEEGRYYEP